MGAEQNACIRLVKYLEDSAAGLLVVTFLADNYSQGKVFTFEKTEFRLAYSLCRQLLHDAKLGITCRFSPTGISTEERISAQIVMTANGLELLDVEDLRSEGADHIERWLDSVLEGLYKFREQSTCPQEVSQLNIRLKDLFLETASVLTGLRKTIAHIALPGDELLTRG
jgi:hypothetical protein